MNRRAIDLETFPRRDHFELFMGMANPFVHVTARVDVTDWLSRQRRSGAPFFLSFLYAVAKAANRVPELRQRALDGGIVEYDVCDPSYTVALPDGTYRYCHARADQPFEDYLFEARRKQAEALRAGRLEEEAGTDALGLLFISTLPWLDYQSLEMPWPAPGASNPNICWGRCAEETRLVLRDGVPVETRAASLPVTVMANHALVDGIHIARFFDELNRALSDMF